MGKSLLELAAQYYGVCVAHNAFVSTHIHLRTVCAGEIGLASFVHSPSWLTLLSPPGTVGMTVGSDDPLGTPRSVAATYSS